MREIKFRAWDIKNKKMYDSYSVDETGNWCLDIEYSNKIETGEDKKLIQQQFTGLKDKNGKDIYEGDIVKDKDGNIGKVDFELGCFWLNDIMKHKDCVERNERSYMVEVIGNIFENPELLSN